MRLNNNNNNNNKLEQSISQPSVYKPITFRIDEYLNVRKHSFTASEYLKDEYGHVQVRVSARMCGHPSV